MIRFIRSASFNGIFTLESKNLSTDLKATLRIESSHSDSSFTLLNVSCFIVDDAKNNNADIGYKLKSVRLSIESFLILFATIFLPISNADFVLSKSSSHKTSILDKTPIALRGLKELPELYLLTISSTFSDTECVKSIMTASGRTLLMKSSVFCESLPRSASSPGVSIIFIFFKISASSNISI